MQIRPLLPKTDHAEWLRMRLTLWPECSSEVHQLEMKQQLNLKPTANLSVELGSTPCSPSGCEAAVFVVDRGNGKLGGFAEVLIKTWAEGCHSGRVAFLEGWYIDKDLRRQGFGSKLITEVEAWARAKNCTEFASDTWPDNEQSHHAHLKLGFTEVIRMIHYRKDL